MKNPSPPKFLQRFHNKKRIIDIFKKCLMIRVSRMTNRAILNLKLLRALICGSLILSLLGKVRM